MHFVDHLTMDLNSNSAYTLKLADGQQWLIRATDPQAGRIVSSLAGAMQLKQGSSGRTIFVAVRDGSLPMPSDINGTHPVTCILSPPTDVDMLTIQMMYLALDIARDAQARGGVLLHGALAEMKDHGVIFAGPGTIGKTTLSRRLPPPWRSLCDDTTLIVRDGDGKYWAHPFPTWSRFYSNGPGGTWDVQRAVPLTAIFFLHQSPDDYLTAINSTQATALLMESTQQVTAGVARKLDRAAVRQIYQEQLTAVNALAQAIPAYMLHFSLTGAFWQEVERVLPSHGDESGAVQGGVADKRNEATIGLLLGDQPLRVVYTGPSMNPTLAEPDLLEVRPYGEQAVCVGDIIYFQSPENERPIIHRVVRVTSQGIRTRGDNNPQNDPYLVQPADIIGKVVAAQRGERKRQIAGRWQGRFFVRGIKLERAVNRLSTRLGHSTYYWLARSGIFRRLLPAAMKPRVVCFQGRHQTFLKLLIAERLIGQYDHRHERWIIQRPFRLFVEEQTLPRAPRVNNL